MKPLATYSVQPIDSRRTSAAEIGLASSSVLMLTSVLLLHVSIQDGSQRPWVEWADLVVTMLIAAAAFYYFRIDRSDGTASLPARHRDGTQSTGKLVVPSLFSTGEIVFLVSFCCLPFATDVVLRSRAAHGNPMEIQFPLAMRNLMFGLIVLPSKTTGRLAMFTSFFLAIFSALVTTSTTTNVLLAVYALLGLWWLMGDYWQRISAHFPDETTMEIPYFARAGVIVLVLVCLAGGAIAFQSSAVTNAVAGFMPSSGGTGGSDPFARGGVGDGEQMVGAKEDADSFGPIESELFLESQQPTLYDMIIENYAEAQTKKRNSRSRAIPLTSKETQKQNHTKFGQNKKATREFSAIRRQTADRKRRKLDDVQSTAMLYVAGRTPLHLGLAIYDHWDGRELSLRGATPEPKLRLDSAADRKWATWDSSAFDGCFSVAESHQLKIVNLNSPTIPTPPNLTATHIDKLHVADFFRWENGLLRLRGDKIPSLTVVHVKSRFLRHEGLDSLVFRRNTSTEQLFSSRLRQLASDWTANASSNWERVELIRKRLREFKHEPKARVPDDIPDAVEHFLFESQLGPDYLFATSAAVLLRSLGFQTRIVSGLYADPQNYDRMAKATGVYSNDVHFWMEIETENGHWVPVEPTPGFEVLHARRTFWQVATATTGGFAKRVLARPVASSILVVAIIGSVLLRRQLYGKAAMLWWQLRLKATPRQQVLGSVLLLQRLTSRKNSCRRDGQTIDQWIGTLGEACPDSDTVREFRSLVSWACYASSDRPAFVVGSVRETCVESVRLLKGCV